MHDAIELDFRGRPAAVICTDSFHVTGRAMARERGVPDYPIAIVRHPIITLGEEELHARAQQAVPRVVDILTGGA